MLNSTATTQPTHTDANETDPTALGRMSGQEREAIANAAARMAALGIDPNAAVYVDDENRLPSYARHLGTAWGGQDLDDEELDYAIGWLPAEAFLNDDSPWPGSYNPYITLAHLRALELQRGDVTTPSPARNQLVLVGTGLADARRAQAEIAVGVSPPRSCQHHPGWDRGGGRDMMLQRIALSGQVCSGQRLA